MYSLAQVPTNVEWGPSPLSHLLHDPVVDRPIKLGVVGTVVDFSSNVVGGGLVGSTGPQSTTILRLRLLRPADSADMVRLITMGRRRPCKCIFALR